MIETTVDRVFISAPMGRLLELRGGGPDGCELRHSPGTLVGSAGQGMRKNSRKPPRVPTRYGVGALSRSLTASPRTVRPHGRASKPFRRSCVLPTGAFQLCRRYPSARR